MGAFPDSVILLPKNVKNAAEKLLCTGGYLVYFGFNKPDIAKKLWFYIYDKDIYPSRVFSPSLKSPDNVPVGASSLMAEVYFSKENIELLQSAIRYEVNQITGKVIDKQSPTELSIVMRSIYLQNGNPMVSSNSIKKEVVKLNSMVIDYCSEQISTQVLQYQGYIQKLTTLPVPIERPQQVDRNNFTYDISNLL